MATEKFTVGGIEKLRIGAAKSTPDATVPTTGMIDITDFINPGSVTRTKNRDNIERLIADGKSVAYVTFRTPGDPNTIAIALLDQNPEVEQLLSNIVYDAATTTITELADRKLANICIEITTAPLNGKKCIIFIPNVDASLSTADPLTFNNVEKFVIDGEIKSYMTTDNKEAISIKKWVTPAGTAIDSTP